MPTIELLKAITAIRNIEMVVGKNGMNAKGSEVLIETLEITHEQIIRVG